MGSSTDQRKKENHGFALKHSIPTCIMQVKHSAYKSDACLHISEVVGKNILIIDTLDGGRKIIEFHPLPKEKTLICVRDVSYTKSVVVKAIVDDLLAIKRRQKKVF